MEPDLFHPFDHQLSIITFFLSTLQQKKADRHNDYEESKQREKSASAPTNNYASVLANAYANMALQAAVEESESPARSSSRGGRKAKGSVERSINGRLGSLDSRDRSHQGPTSKVHPTPGVTTCKSMHGGVHALKDASHVDRPHRASNIDRSVHRHPLIAQRQGPFGDRSARGSGASFLAPGSFDSNSNSHMRDGSLRGGVAHRTGLGVAHAATNQDVSVRNARSPGSVVCIDGSVRGGYLGGSVRGGGVYLAGDRSVRGGGGAAAAGPGAGPMVDASTVTKEHLMDLALSKLGVKRDIFAGILPSSGDASAGVHVVAPGRGSTSHPGGLSLALGQAAQPKSPMLGRSSLQMATVFPPHSASSPGTSLPKAKTHMGPGKRSPSSLLFAGEAKVTAASNESTVTVSGVGGLTPLKPTAA